MTGFVIRNLMTNSLGSVLENKTGFIWLDGGYVHMLPKEGLEIKTFLEDGQTLSRHEKIYKAVDLPETGSGPVLTYGSLEYDAVNDRVTRTRTRSDPALTGNRLKVAVNSEADRRILLAYPLSEQLWGSLRGLRLVHKIATGGTLTNGEITVMTAISTAADYVNAIRTSRLALIASGSANFSTITSDSNWPPTP